MSRTRADIIATPLSVSCVFRVGWSLRCAAQEVDGFVPETGRYIGKALHDNVISIREADSLALMVREVLGTWREDEALNRIRDYIDAEYERSMREMMAWPSSAMSGGLS